MNEKTPILGIYVSMQCEKLSKRRFLCIIIDLIMQQVPDPMIGFYRPKE